MWRGPVGETLRTLCFSPNTLVTMNDGSRKKIKDIVIGETLENGVDVIATLKIKGGTEHCFYKIWSDKLNTEILVTGTHKIINPKNNEEIFVQDFDKAEKSIFWGPVMHCLITDNHTIPIGEFTFKDWED